MTPKVGDWNRDITVAQKKIHIIRQKLSEIFNVRLENVIERETDFQYQMKGDGDYTIVL